LIKYNKINSSSNKNWISIRLSKYILAIINFKPIFII
jgi:hypothetical protein